MVGFDGRSLTRVHWFCVFVGIILGCASSKPAVDTPVGKIVGIAGGGNGVNRFLGIPFAKPPVGPLRFKKPEPADAFQTTYSATKYGPPCVPNDGGEEDCLFLNLFVPVNASHDSPLPVMVWVHGGGFQFDTAARYDGTVLADRGDVIVVTMNYRLGVFGFLNTRGDSGSGNYGLWDQRLALKWVQKNIESFGGDPDRVTLIGESAGAAGAAYHALFPERQTLFQTMILQSGTAVAPFAFNRNPRHYALEFAQRVGCGESSGLALMGCLRSQNVTHLTTNSQGMVSDLGMSVIDFTWVPSVDGEFVIDDPNKLITNNTFLRDIGFFDIDLLLGMTNDEGSLVFKLAAMNGVAKRNVTLDPINGVSKSFYENEFIPAIVSQKFGNSTNETNLAMSYMYELNTAPEDRQMVSNAEWFRAYSDATFLSSVTRHALVHSSGEGSGKTYVYLFDHHPSTNTDPEVTGTPHGGDVPYVFGFLAPVPGAFTGEEANLSEIVIRYWSNMAKSGMPNEPKDVYVAWPEFNQSEQTFLKLSTEMSSANSTGMGLFSKRAKFWLDFMPAILPRETEVKGEENTAIPEPKPESTQPKSEAFIERFNIDSPTAEATIIALAVVVALLAAVIILTVIVVMYLNRRRKSKSNYSVS